MGRPHIPRRHRHPLGEGNPFSDLRVDPHLETPPTESHPPENAWRPDCHESISRPASPPTPEGLTLRAIVHLKNRVLCAAFGNAVFPEPNLERGCIRTTRRLHFWALVGIDLFPPYHQRNWRRGGHPPYTSTSAKRTHRVQARKTRKTMHPHMCGVQNLGSKAGSEISQKTSPTRLPKTSDKHLLDVLRITTEQTLCGS